MRPHWPSWNLRKKKLNRCKNSLKNFYKNGVLSLLLSTPFLFVAMTAGAEESNLSTSSSWDSKLTLDTSYPPAAVINFWAGIYEKFNLARLRRLNRELAPFEHGYIRPHIRLLSSVRVNHIEPRFDLYPFTFLGLTGGWTFSQRSLSGIGKFQDYTHYDCTKIGCDGWNYLPFAEAKFKWGYKDFFGVFFVRRDWAWAEGPGFKLSYDPSSGMAFDSSLDHLNQFWVLAGVKVSEASQILTRYKYLEWAKSGQYRRDVSLLYSVQFSDAWKGGADYTHGFRSDGYQTNTFALRVEWSIRKTPAAEDALD